MTGLSRDEQRMIEKEDFRFLTEKDAIWTAPLSDILNDHGICFVTRNVLGAGIAAKVGPILERTSFYVVHTQLEKAQEVLAAYFDEKADMHFDCDEYSVE